MVTGLAGRLVGLHKTTVIKADPPCSISESKINQTSLNWRQVRKPGPRNEICGSWPKGGHHVQISTSQHVAKISTYFLI